MPQLTTAQAMVRFLLTAPSCGQARAGRFDACSCGCVGVLTRHVEEQLEQEYSRVIAEHRAEICARPENG